MRQKHRRLSSEYEQQLADHAGRISILQEELGKLNDLLEKSKEEVEEKEVQINKLEGQVQELDNIKLDFETLRARFESNKSKWDVPSSEIEENLISHVYRLHYRPQDGPGASKEMHFVAGGNIMMGQNKNENSWRTHDGKLELLDSKGKVFSRFYYHPDTRVFISSGDSDVRVTGQYMLPDYERTKEIEAYYKNPKPNIDI